MLKKTNTLYTSAKGQNARMKSHFYKSERKKLSKLIVRISKKNFIILQPIRHENKRTAHGAGEDLRQTVPQASISLTSQLCML